MADTAEDHLATHVMTLSVKRALDIVICQYKARAFAAALGFSRREQWEVAIAVSEAVTNILKYAGSGELRLRSIPTGTIGLEFEAVDHGQGIGDIDQALRDGMTEGHDTTDDCHVCSRRGLGLGLGTIQRLMDVLEIQSSKNGTCVRARRWHVERHGR